MMVGFYSLALLQEQQALSLMNTDALSGEVILSKCFCQNVLFPFEKMSALKAKNFSIKTDTIQKRLSLS